MTHDPLCSHSRQFRWFQKIDPCQCDLITAAHERGYKEAERIYTNDCMLCGYAGEFSTSVCWQCELEE